MSGLDAKTTFAEITDRPGIRSLRWGLKYDLDSVGKTVSSSLAGLFASRAIFREGLGCVLLNGRKPPYLVTSDIAAVKAPKDPPLLPEIAGLAQVDAVNPNLKAALDQQFEEPDAPPFRRTKAVVILHEGSVIAERYADGIGIETPLLGFSMSKLMVNALIGILTREGRLSPSLAAPIAEWSKVDDARHAIRIEDLMRMTSGLALDETDSGFDPSSQMMYLQGDTAGFAAKADAVAPPGTRWAYSSASTQLLSRIIRDTVGGPEQTLAFAWSELFNPLGMRNATLEFDAVGTMMGCSHMLASARDWARLGLLYMNDGIIGGHRIFPAGWVNFSASATLGSDYGAGVWTNRSKNEKATRRVRIGIPRDAFYAAGDLGQRIIIIPSQRLLIVRLGDGLGPTGDFLGLGALLREAIAAIHH